jgi:hypothetical protein
MPSAIAYNNVGIQGDQIGRIFAHWVIVYLRQFFLENNRSSPHFGATFFHGEVSNLILKEWVGLYFGRFDH